MISKIKAEIERMDKLVLKSTEYGAYSKCLKWAEDLEKDLKDYGVSYIITDKVFHGGQDE